ncbi:hypothetical protein TNCV_3778231 [Trichonephila clavipes]|nr:hypothetical protein TNCV_3778231 [Trichonephila clavipes]
MGIFVGNGNNTCRHRRSRQDPFEVSKASTSVKSCPDVTVKIYMWICHPVHIQTGHMPFLLERESYHTGNPFFKCVPPQIILLNPDFHKSGWLRNRDLATTVSMTRGSQSTWAPKCVRKNSQHVKGTKKELSLQGPLNISNAGA